jgi:hypothetical protein
MPCDRGGGPLADFRADAFPRAAERLAREALSIGPVRLLFRHEPAADDRLRAQALDGGASFSPNALRQKRAWEKQ